MQGCKHLVSKILQYLNNLKIKKYCGKHATERVGLKVKLCTCIRELPVRNIAEAPIVLTEVFRAFSQYHQANAEYYLD
jgi:hypothetical protein